MASVDSYDDKFVKAPNADVVPQRSQIGGQGHGDCHLWQHQGARQVGSAHPIEKCSTWKCMRCNTIFKHFYDIEPAIFKAMKKAEVPNTCSSQEPSTTNSS